MNTIIGLPAARATRELAKLRDFHRMLRYHEVQHGPIFGLREVRQHVVEQMRKAAKQVHYTAAVPR